MPTVLTFPGHRVVIYANDHRPCHVHVMSCEHEAVFELNCPLGPPVLRENYGFKGRRLGLIAARLSGELRPLCNEWRRIHGHY